MKPIILTANLTVCGLCVSMRGKDIPDAGFVITGIDFTEIKNGCPDSYNSCGHPELKRFAGIILRHYSGKPAKLSEIALDTSSFSNFRKRVTSAAQQIPYGETVSYSGLAAMAGFPSAVRAAASVMRQNPFPLAVPCHRVIRRNGSVGGFAGMANGSLPQIKRMLIKMESQYHPNK